MGLDYTLGLNILTTDRAETSTPLALHDRCSDSMCMQLRLNGTVHQMIDLARPHPSSSSYHLRLLRCRGLSLVA